MVANLANNIQNSLPKYNIRENYGWPDSTVALHWLQGSESYKQFVHNRVKHIDSKMPMTGRYVDTIRNPANIGSRRSNIENLPKEWWDGSRWLAYSDYFWPDQKEVTPTKDSAKEAMCIATEESEGIYQLSKKCDFGKLFGLHLWFIDFLKIEKFL